MMDWKSRTTYTARIGNVEGVVEQPDSSGYCRTLVRIVEPGSARNVHRGAVHGLDAAKSTVQEMMENFAASGEAAEAFRQDQ